MQAGQLQWNWQERALVDLIQEEHGRLDFLVNDIFVGDRYAQGDKPLWEDDLDGGLRMLRMGVDTHLITLAKALPLMRKRQAGVVVEVTARQSQRWVSRRDGCGPK